MKLEGEKYSRIRPRDYISYLRDRTADNNVQVALKTNDHIRNWVEYSILRCDHLRKRSDILKFFALTAEVMMKR